MTKRYSQNFIERLPAGSKLATLCFFSLALFFIKNPFIMLGIVIALICLFVIAQFSLHDILKIFKPMWWVILIVACFQFFIVSPDTAFTIILRLIAFIMAASLVTMTTTTTQMLETFEYLFQPLKIMGINPRKISLALSLTLRFIPLFQIILHDVQEAQKVRGLEKNIIALIIPVLIKMLKMSDDVANAIEARCYDKD